MMIDTIRFHRRAVFVALLTLIATLLLAGCGDPKKDARQELSKMNVEYTADAFNKAIESKDDTVVQLFFKAAFDLSSKDDNGKTPCMAAANSGNMDVLNKIIEQDADRQKDVDSKNHAPISYATMAKQAEAFVALKDGADWTLMDSDGNSLLHLAVLSDQMDFVTEAMSHGIDVNAKNKNGETALLLAAKNGNADLVQMLLDKQADKMIADKDGLTPVKAAKTIGKQQIVDMLGGDPEEATKQQKAAASSPKLVTYHTDGEHMPMTVSETDITIHVGEQIHIAPDATCQGAGVLRTMGTSGSWNGIRTRTAGRTGGKGSATEFIITGKSAGTSRFKLVPNYGDWDHAVDMMITVID